MLSNSIEDSTAAVWIEKNREGSGFDLILSKKFTDNINETLLHFTRGARGGVVVKALRNKTAGRGFDSRWFH
jgi:hypothetical protein